MYFVFFFFLPLFSIVYTGSDVGSGQRAVGRGQRAVDRGQMAVDRGQWAKGGICLRLGSCERCAKGCD